MITNPRQKKFVKNIEKYIPKLVIEKKSASTKDIIDNLLKAKTGAMGTICHFNEYPELNDLPKNITDDLEIVNNYTGRVAVLLSSHNQMFDIYNTITINSLLKKDIVLYSPYRLEDNHFYKFLHMHGAKRIKYVTDNLYSYYNILDDTKCVSLGVVPNNYFDESNPFYFENHKIQIIPLRENIEMTYIRFVNQYLFNDNQTVMREIINKCFV